LSDTTAPPHPGYTAGLKAALTGRHDASFVWRCNFEVEDQWARDYVGLPTVKLATTASTVHRMEQLGAQAGKDRSTSSAVLASTDMLDQLRQLAVRGAYLMPMGNSPDEQKIEEATGLPLAVPDAATFERVNSKIYSRRLVEDLGLRAIPGHCVETVAQLRAVLGDGLSGGEPVIVKEAYGESGKRLVVLDSPSKAMRLLRMIEQRGSRTGDERLHVVVERFLPKRFDLNYQFTIDRTGRVRLGFVKEALTVHGVHKGHIMPAGLTATQHEEIADAAEKIGARLYADGLFGVVCVDALLGTDDLVYPVLEINARLNMSSYQGRSPSVSCGTATARWPNTTRHGDVIGKRVPLPPVEPGDLLGVERSGAYGPSASPGLFLSHGFSRRGARALWRAVLGAGAGHQRGTAPQATNRPDGLKGERHDGPCETVGRHRDRAERGART
jgi:hypothetical protein